MSRGAERCKDCQFFEAGYCHRRSPIITQWENFDQYGIRRQHFDTTWPLVSDDNWCGDFEAKHEEHFHTITPNKIGTDASKV